MSLDLDGLRAQLADRSGPRFWRSLDQLADTPEFQAFLRAEFPSAAVPPRGADRRRFLKLMAASLLLGGLAGCDDDDGRDVEIPYVRRPLQQEPGLPLAYATAIPLDGIANGALVTTRNGRPIKVEGNPQHPWSRGGTDVLMQAAVLGMYDPDRSQSVLHLARISDWDAFRAALTGEFAALRAAGGGGLRLLTGPVSSPTQLAQLAAMQRDFPGMHWHAYAPAGRDAALEGARRAYGRKLETRWRFDRADVVVALDGDFLDLGPDQVGASRDWIDARRASAGRGGLLALHAAAPTPSLTLAKADHRLTAGPAALMALAAGLLADATSGRAPPGGDAAATWRARAATALLAARGRGIVLAGAAQPPELHEAVHRINAALGNLGQTVFHTAPVVAEAEPIEALTAAMHDCGVDVLAMLDCNPVYAVPADLGFAAALDRVRLKIHAGLYADETALRCDWHAPLAHPLEAWGDARAPDGTVTLMQPTVAPIYDGRSAPEILSMLVDAHPRSGGDMLRDTARGGADAAAFEPRWHQALLDGFLPGTALPALDVQLVPAAAAAAAPPAEGMQLLFRPDPTIWDGAMANNAWLQELPKPLTKLVWSNAVGLSPADAGREALRDGDLVRVELAGRAVTGAARILPGQAPGVVLLTLGYGRGVSGAVMSGLGYDANALRSAATPWQAAGVRIARAGGREALVSTQDHGAMPGDDFVHVHRLGSPAGGPAPAPPTLYADPEQDRRYAPDGDGRAWGMVIDIDACTGCNACVVACQAENNIPVVGREQVAAGREMHWLRIDRYYAGPPDEPATHFMPVPCMHCEQAPCEVGCPVEATLHDHEGLNLMVYNRCVGTRTCESYCPYKVRHFNWLDYNEDMKPSEAARANPEVTLRARGVMEKCTYCVQRIAEARIDADKAVRPIADGEVETACQGACPTRAIVFGDLRDPDSRVAAASRDPRNYPLLGELNTRPRTTYLAALAPADAGPAG